MVVLRPTVKASRGLPPTASISEPSDGALGDWYINRLTIARQPLLLLISSTCSLAILTPARDVASLPKRFPDLLRHRLRRLGAAPDQIAHEIDSLAPVLIGRTCDRSVVGTLVEFARMAPAHLAGVTDVELVDTEAWLSRVPARPADHHAQYHFPDRAALAMLEQRWADREPDRPALRLIR
jgi:hypothetical protein